MLYSARQRFPEAGVARIEVDAHGCIALKVHRKVNNFPQKKNCDASNIFVILPRTKQKTMRLFTFDIIIILVLFRQREGSRLQSDSKEGRFGRQPRHRNQIKLKGDNMPVGRFLADREHFKSLSMPIQKGDMVTT